MEVFLTITSPVFSELVLILWGENLQTGVSLLVLDQIQWERLWELEEALDSVITRGSLDFLDSPPSICEIELSALIG